MSQSRREFLSDTFSVCSTFGVASALSALGSRTSKGNEPQKSPLVEIKDDATGIPLLRLPEGFSYRSFAWAKDKMSDGTLNPSAHDGMGVVKSENDVITLVRNHEVSSDGPAMNLRCKNGEPYDENAQGGCTTLKFNTKKGELEESFVSFSGTSRNCAGGVTPWGTWLTCEETVLGPGSIDHYKKDKRRDFKKEHGWIFEVDPDGSSEPIPLEDMGRFVHEAVAVDRETGIVYETEDRGTSCFYRFVPNQPGKLSAGGTLQAAEVVGQDDLRKHHKNGATFDVRWHDVPNPKLPHTPGKKKPDELGVYTQAKKLGCTTFSRLEGCWSGNSSIYFDATSGGGAKAGQIWQYDPKKEKLILLFESPSKPTLNMPDNLCVSPQGGLVLCEDNNYGVTEFPQRMFTLTQDGKLKLFAENNVQLRGEINGFKGDFRTKEWAGATFSPDGKWLFVNIQSPGITFAITGPWESAFAT